MFARSKVAPRKLSIKQPTVPDITDTKIAETGFETTPKKYADKPMINAPIIPTAVPNTDTAPSVPGSTFWNVVISLGCCRIPISEAKVSAVAVAIAPMNPPTKGK